MKNCISVLGLQDSILLRYQFFSNSSIDSVQFQSTLGCYSVWINKLLLASKMSLCKGSRKKNNHVKE